MTPRLKLGIAVSVASLFVVLGRPSRTPLSAAVHASENCAPEMRLAPDVVERRCLSRADLSEGEVRQFMARDLALHLPSNRRCTLVIGLRVMDDKPALAIRVGPMRVVLDAAEERALYVGAEALTVSLVGEVLEVANVDGTSKSEVSPVADRMGRIQVESHDDRCADFSFVVDRLGG